MPSRPFDPREGYSGTVMRDNTGRRVGASAIDYNLLNPAERERLQRRVPKGWHIEGPADREQVERVWVEQVMTESEAKAGVKCKEPVLWELRTQADRDHLAAWLDRGGCFCVDEQRRPCPPPSWYAKGSSWSKATLDRQRGWQEHEWAKQGRSW